MYHYFCQFLNLTCFCNSFPITVQGFKTIGKVQLISFIYSIQDIAVKRNQDIIVFIPCLCDPDLEIEFPGYVQENRRQPRQSMHMVMAIDMSWGYIIQVKFIELSFDLGSNLFLFFP